jgi:hypothetical protein
MGGDLEAGGALTTAALVASQVEGQAGKPPPADAPAAACLNCGAALSGAYCPACGQRAHLHRSLLHLAEEVLHGVLHFDAKAWRTLPLLAFRPGVLTRRYIDGQRTRYVSPLALFLFTVFLMYFVFSLTGAGPVTPQSLNAELQAEGRAELLEAVEEARADVERREARLERARERAQGKAPAASEPDGVAQAEQALAGARQELVVAEAGLAAFNASVDQKDMVAAAAAAAASASGGVNVRWPETAQVMNAKVNTGHPALDNVIRRALANPDLALYKLKNTAYKFSFMLVPISLPFLWLLFFWRRGITAYDHAVFSLYSLSFMSVFFVALVLLNLTPADGLVPLLLVTVPPLHMYLQVRDTYGLKSTASAVWHTLALFFIVSTVFALFVLFILAVGLV